MVRYFFYSADVCDENGAIVGAATGVIHADNRDDAIEKVMLRHKEDNIHQIRITEATGRDVAIFHRSANRRNREENVK